MESDLVVSTVGTDKLRVPNVLLCRSKADKLYRLGREFFRREGDVNAPEAFLRDFLLEQQMVVLCDGVRRL